MQIATSNIAITLPIRGYKDSIKRLTRGLIDDYIHEKGWKRYEDIRINLQELYEILIYPIYEIKLITNLDLGYLDGQKILGKYLVEEREILIDASLSSPLKDPRLPFTHGHEFGHAALRHGGKSNFRCSSRQIFDDEIADILEIQANSFAENLLMPDDIVRKKFMICYDLSRPIRYIGPRVYCHCPYGACRKYEISSYTDFCRIFASPLTGDFADISKTSLGLKIHKLGLVNNCTDEKFKANSFGGGGDSLGSILIEKIEKMLR